MIKAVGFVAFNSSRRQYLLHHHARMRGTHTSCHDDGMFHEPSEAMKCGMLAKYFRSQELMRGK